MGHDVGLLDDGGSSALRTSAPVVVHTGNGSADDGQQEHEPAVFDTRAIGPVEGAEERPRDQSRERTAEE